MNYRREFADAFASWCVANDPDTQEQGYESLYQWGIEFPADAWDYLSFQKQVETKHICRAFVGVLD